MITGHTLHDTTSSGWGQGPSRLGEASGVAAGRISPVASAPVRIVYGCAALNHLRALVLIVMQCKGRALDGQPYSWGDLSDFPIQLFGYGGRGG